MKVGGISSHVDGNCERRNARESSQDTRASGWPCSLAKHERRTKERIREDASGSPLAVIDTAEARAAYQDFLTLWKDADPDIPILKQAKAEYAKLQ